MNNLVFSHLFNYTLLQQSLPCFYESGTSICLLLPSSITLHMLKSNYFLRAHRQ